MIQLKANPQLKAIFSQLIKTMGVNVAWNEVFVIINNNLILLGSVRSLFFNFDNRKAVTNIIDIPVNEEQLVQIEENSALTNALNMTLYAFGRWGSINGLKVEKGYPELQKLFHGILSEIGLDADYREENFRFYHAGVQITYEDVIQEAVRAAEERPEEDEESKEDAPGLWHNVRWVTQSAVFQKSLRTEEERKKDRLGRNFYMVDYRCPFCGEKLYMVLYPEGGEYPIDTDEGKVFLARAYACAGCACLFTPRPGRLIIEGDIYALDFEEDKTAFEDYIELIGKTGGRTPNYKFNEYEWQRGRKEQERESLEEQCARIESMVDEELDRLQNMMEEGFYPWEDTERFRETVERQAMHRRKRDGGSGANAQEPPSRPGEPPASPGNSGRAQELAGKTIEELKRIAAEQQKSGTLQAAVADHLRKKLRAKFDARMPMLEKMSGKQLTDLKQAVKEETYLEPEERRSYEEQIDRVLFQKEEEQIRRKAEACFEKPYSEIERAIEQIKAHNCPDRIKEPILQELYKKKKIRGEQEVQALLQKLPAAMDKKQYLAFMEKLAGYREVDLAPYQKQLDEKRDLAEQQEIARYVKRARKADRNDLFQLYNQLKEQGFEEKNTAPFLEKIQKKIYEMDKAAIDRICSNLSETTFEEGLKICETIASGPFLPELKQDTLAMLEKRLTKMKIDESEQLVRKLRTRIEERGKSCDRLYFYEARKAFRGEMDAEKEHIFGAALQHYAMERTQYEYPIAVCDSSRANNGKEGFLLTPDHLFYQSLFGSGRIDVNTVKNVLTAGGILNKGIYIRQQDGKKTKLPCGIKAEDWEVFAEILQDFISYLQEKPESRNISYLQKEKHEVKCCFRCGFHYQGGDMCPKCGYKSNH